MSATGKKNMTFAEALTWAKAELEKARDALESSANTDLETEALRARIVVMRELIALPNKSPAPVFHEVPGY